MFPEVIPIPLTSYCKKCGQDVPVSDFCPNCRSKLAASTVRLAWCVEHHPVRDWMCWNAVMRLLLPVLALTLLLVILLEAIVGGLNGVAMLLGGGLLLLSANAGLIVRRVMSNPVTRFISSVSLQFYIWHQTIAVWLLKYRVIPSEYENPNWEGDAVWQMRYTLACFLVSLAVAAVLTYGFERPAARALQKRYDARKMKKEKEAA